MLFALRWVREEVADNKFLLRRPRQSGQLDGQVGKHETGKLGYSRPVCSQLAAPAGGALDICSVLMRVSPNERCAWLIQRHKV